MPFGITRTGPSGYSWLVNYAQLLFPDFSLILVGYLICRFTALDRTVWQQVESLVYFLLFPVLLFQAIARSPLDWATASSFVGAGLSMAVAAIALAYSLPWWPWLGRYIDRHEHAAAAQVGFRFNSFIGLALIDRLAGPQGQLLMAVLIGFCVPLFNVAAVWPMAHHAGRGLVRELLRNPLIIATVSGLTFNLLGLHIPTWIEPTLTRLGAASIAMGLMAAGAGMELGHLNSARVLTVLVLMLKHLSMPLLASLMAHVFGLTPLQTLVLMTFSALPTASSCYVLAARMGFNGPYVAALVTVSTLLAMASLPFALSGLAQ